MKTRFQTIRPVLFIVFTVAGLLAGPISRAQGIAYVFRDTILLNTPGYKENMIKYENLKKGFTAEIDSAGKQWQQKLTDLLKPYGIKESETIADVRKRMQPEDTAKLGLLISEQAFITAKTKMCNDVLQQTWQREVQSILKKVNAEIEAYAKASKLDAVFIMEDAAQMMAYVNKGRDVTAQITSRVKKWPAPNSSTN
jgi:Skp family chaperone for outer membrane proteins